MKKNVFGRRLKRDTNERKALFKGLLSSLVLQGRIKTTQEKAKSIKGQADKLIAIALKGEAIADSYLQRYLIPNAIKKIVRQIAPRFKKRGGGYTRIIKLGNRQTDSASMVLMEWVEGETVVEDVKKEESLQLKKGKKTKIKVKTKSDLVKKPTQKLIKPVRKTASKKKEVKK